MNSPVHNSYRPLSEEGGKEFGSESSFLINFVTLIISIGIVVWRYGCGNSPSELVVILIVSLLVISVAMETIFFPRTCGWRRLHFRRTLSWRRVMLREVALLVTLGVVGIGYWLFPMFADGGMRRHFYPFLGLVVPFIIVASIPYFCLMDRLDDEEEDVYVRLGRAIISCRCTLTRFELGNYVRSWLVKAFWLSLMHPSMIEKIQWFVTCKWDEFATDLGYGYLVVSTGCYAIDLCYAVCGYLLNLKLLNTHTRTAEPTLLGWACTLMCYWPFWGVLFGPYFLRYQPKYEWGHYFATGSTIWWIWGGMIIAMEFLYAMATVAAGVRFSNLTYRGLWATGPYRWTKHPAYVCKNISWWLISVPFLAVASDGFSAIKCCLLLLCVNIVYYIRARTEERHLSHYPEYVAYALAMNEKSVFRWCARIFPFLRYRPPSDMQRLFVVAN